MDISEEWLSEKQVPPIIVDWWRVNKTLYPVEFLEELIREGRLEWANSLLTKMMGYKEYVTYAVHAAEQVVGIYERKRPKWWTKSVKNIELYKCLIVAKKCALNPLDTESIENAKNIYYKFNYDATIGLPVSLDPTEPVHFHNYLNWSASNLAANSVYTALLSASHAFDFAASTSVYYASLAKFYNNPSVKYHTDIFKDMIQHGIKLYVGEKC